MPKAKAQIENKQEVKPEDIIEKTGPDADFNQRVYNFKVLEEETRVIEIKGIELTAKFYKTTNGSAGIRIPLYDNGKLMDEFANYCNTVVKAARIEKAKDEGLISFTCFGLLDKGLDFFPMFGFYVFPVDKQGIEPHVIFSQEKDVPAPMERLEAFVEYYRKKFSIEAKPRRGLFDSLEGLDLTDL